MSYLCLSLLRFFFWLHIVDPVNQIWDVRRQSSLAPKYCLFSEYHQLLSCPLFSHAKAVVCLLVVFRPQSKV